MGSSRPREKATEQPKLGRYQTVRGFVSPVALGAAMVAGYRLTQNHADKGAMP